MFGLCGNQKIICIDFDGVLHNHSTQHPNMRKAIGPPIIDVTTGRNSIEWLTQLIEIYVGLPDPTAYLRIDPPVNAFDICIFSARSRHWGGRKGMKKWLVKNGLDPRYLAVLRFPLMKPMAHLIIDDRAFHFQGVFPTGKYIENFKPWGGK